MTEPALRFDDYAARVLAKLGIERNDVLRAAVIAEVERAVIDERQAVVLIVEKHETRAHEEASTRWTLESARKAIDIRALITEEHVAKLAAFLSGEDWTAQRPGQPRTHGGLDGLNAVAKTSFTSFEQAARAILLGMAPQRLDDDKRVWCGVEIVTAKIRT